MNTQEATKLLALIKVAYPNSYKGMDNASLMATVNMWAMSFPKVPYPIMEQAFNGLRMQLKFPPTVAEMAEQLRKLHFEADEIANVQRFMGNREAENRYRAVAAATAGFKDWPNVSAFGHGTPALTGGDYYAGASGDRLDRGYGLPQLDAGRL